MKKRAFTVLELTITLIVICVLVGMALMSYQLYVEKAKSGEAIVNVGAIRKAEEMYRLLKGEYINADNADEISQRLSLEITPKFYEYRIVGATADNFLVVARRIGENLGEYLGSGAIPSELMVVAMDKTGGVSNTDLFATTGGQGAGTTGGGGSWGGVSGITSWIGGTPGSGTGGTTGGGGGGSSGGGTGGGELPQATGGSIPQPVVYSAEIQAALEKVASVGSKFIYISESGVSVEGDSGQYYYDLIQEKNINVAYIQMNPSWLGYWSSSDNLIAINESLKTDPGWPTETISAIITHEATHADYSYNPATWVNRITTLWPQAVGPYFVDPAELLDPFGDLYYSITEEYFTNANEAQLWKEYQADYAGVPGDGITFEDGKVSRYEQGEAVVRAYLRAIPSYAGLPEFYPGN